MRHVLPLLALALAACGDDPVVAVDGGLPPVVEAGLPPPLAPGEGQQAPPAAAPPSGPPTSPPPANGPEEEQEEGAPPAQPPPVEEDDPESPPPDDDDPAPEAEEQEPPADECAEAGDACDTCACRVCADLVDRCRADPRCQAVVECARRTGCDGIGCLEPCGAEIDDAGGALSEPVALASELGDCRADSCGDDPADCVANDPGPPAPEGDPDPGEQSDPPPADEPDPNDGAPDPDPEEPVPPAGEPQDGECDRFAGDLFCGEGIHRGVEYCEFYVETDGRTCDDFCQAGGSFCIEGWSDEDDDCVTDRRVGCEDEANDQVCRCAR